MDNLPKVIRYDQTLVNVQSAYIVDSIDLPHPTTNTAELENIDLIKQLEAYSNEVMTAPLEIEKDPEPDTNTCNTNTCKLYLFKMFEYIMICFRCKTGPVVYKI